ncbi:MAG: hypothetical protein WA268_26635, partial [Xanthobacteraceae bacterium]
GHVLLVNSPPAFTIVPHLRKLNFDPLTSIEPICVRIPAIVTTRSDGSRPPVPIDRGQSDGAVRCIL